MNNIKVRVLRRCEQVEPISSRQNPSVCPPVSFTKPYPSLGLRIQNWSMCALRPWLPLFRSFQYNCCNLPAAAPRSPLLGLPLPVLHLAATGAATPPLLSPAPRCCCFPQLATRSTAPRFPLPAATVAAAPGVVACNSSCGYLLAAVNLSPLLRLPLQVLQLAAKGAATSPLLFPAPRCC